MDSEELRFNVSDESLEFKDGFSFDEDSEYDDIVFDYNDIKIKMNEVNSTLQLEVLDDKKEILSMNFPIPEGSFKEYCKILKETYEKNKGV